MVIQLTLPHISISVATPSAMTKENIQYARKWLLDAMKSLPSESDIATLHGIGRAVDEALGIAPEAFERRKTNTETVAEIQAQARPR